MKHYIRFNLYVAGAVLILALICLILYCAVIKKKGTTRFTPLRAIALILIAAFPISVGGNLYYLDDFYQRLDQYSNLNTVYVSEVDDANPDFYSNVYVRYADADRIPGYTRTVKLCNDIKFTYYLGQYRESYSFPNFIVFAEYVGDYEFDPDDKSEFIWNSISVFWEAGGEDRTALFCFGDYSCPRMMLVGSCDKFIDKLSISMFYKIEGETEILGSEDISILLNTQEPDPFGNGAEEYTPPASQQ